MISRGCRTLAARALTRPQCPSCLVPVAILVRGAAVEDEALGALRLLEDEGEVVHPARGGGGGGGGA